MFKIILTLTALAILSSCRDAGISKISNLGNSATIKCYSGGMLIFERKSTGKVLSGENSDGYYFRDASDKKLKEVSGTCIIAYD